MAKTPNKTLGQIVAKSVNGRVTSSGKTGVIAQTANGKNISRSDLGFTPVIQSSSKLPDKVWGVKDAGNCSGKKKSKPKK